MKKRLFLAVLFIGVSFAVSAQGIYFDIGIGVGKAWTEVNGVDFVEVLDPSGENIDEIGVDLSLKLGYGPFGSIPLYVVGEFEGIGHRIYDSENYIQFNSYLIGPGVIFYPIPFIQLGLSVGYSYIANQTDIPGLSFYNSKSGFAWNVSAAFDLGMNNSGFLIGVKYFNAENTIKITNAKEKASLIAIFVKFAYRNKI